MNKPSRVAAVLAALGLIGALTLTGSAAREDSNPTGRPATMSGGRYVLGDPNPSSMGAPRGGIYQLAPLVPTVAPSGCCCQASLPCVRR